MTKTSRTPTDLYITAFIISLLFSTDTFWSQGGFRVTFALCLSTGIICVCHQAGSCNSSVSLGTRLLTRPYNL